MKTISISALLILWQLLLSPSYTIRYRLTIDVAVGDQIKSGSGVIEMIWHDQSNYPLTEVSWGLEIRGEAIPVDLGSRGRLFALLGPPDAARRGSTRRWGPTWPPIDAFAPNLGIGSMTASVLSSWMGRRDVAELAPSLLPMIVRFRGIDDPKTVEEVDPTDLSSSFGPDVRIARATVQIVPAGTWPFNRLGVAAPEWLFGELVTTGIEDQLPPWYAKLEESTRLARQMLALGGGGIMNKGPLANRMATFSFQRGIEP